MRPRPSALLVAALVLVVAVPAFAPATAGQTDWNDQVCPVCGPTFETAAAANGVSVTVEESTAVVEVERDGTAHWTVRNRLSNASRARRLADADLGPALRDRLDAHLKLDAERVRNVSTRADGDTVVVTFTDTDAGTRAFGRTVVTHFWLEQGMEGGPFYRFEADRVTVVGPEGTRVVNSPGRDGERIDDARVGGPPGIDGSVDSGFTTENERRDAAAESDAKSTVEPSPGEGRWVVWSNATADYPPPSVNSFVVFGSHTGPGSALQTDLALLSVRSEGHLGTALTWFVPFALVIGVLVLGGVVALTRVLPLREHVSVEDGAGVLGVLALALLVNPYLPGVPFGGDSLGQLLGAVYGVLALALLARARGVDVSRGVAVAVLALAPLAAFAWSLSVGFAGLLIALWLASVVATFALGAARSRPERMATGAVAGVTFCAALVLLGLRVRGLGVVVVPLASLGAALGAAVLYPVGAAFAPGSGSLDGQR